MQVVVTCYAAFIIMRFVSARCSGHRLKASYISTDDPYTLKLQAPSFDITPFFKYLLLNPQVCNARGDSFVPISPRLDTPRSVALQQSDSRMLSDSFRMEVVSATQSPSLSV